MVFAVFVVMVLVMMAGVDGGSGCGRGQSVVGAAGKDGGLPRATMP